MRRLQILIIGVIVSFLMGCSGGGGGGSVVSGGGGGSFQAPPAVTGTTADVVLRFNLARAVPDGVKLRFTGLDASGNVLFGPQEKERAASVTLTLPVTVTRLRIEYLRDGLVVGLVTLNLALSPDTTLTIEDPDFADVVATLTGLAVEPLTLARGTRGNLIAVGTFSDGTTQDLSASVTWTSDTPSVASVSNEAGQRGQVQALEVGSTRISGSLAGQTASATVEVTAATLTSLGVTPPNNLATPGTTLQLTATGVFSDGTTQDLSSQVAWKSSNTALARVSAQGLVTVLAPGTVTLTADFGAQQASANLTISAVPVTGLAVTPVTPTLARGTQLQMTATATLLDGTTEDVTSSAVWSSTDSGNVPVNQGLVTAANLGTSQVSAAFAGFGDTQLVTVTAPVLQTITVNPGHVAIGAGTSQAYTATGAYSDGTSLDLTATATFSSDNLAVATVLGSTASGLTAGQATITATQGAISGQATLTVTDSPLVSLAVTPANPSAAQGTSVQFVAVGTYQDGTTQDLTSQVAWTSSTGAATVSNAAGSNGLAQAVSTTGSPATITATLGATSGAATLTVTAATLVSIQVTPTQPQVVAGFTQTFTATGIYSDGSNQNLTGVASWTSSAPAVASMAANVATGLVAGQTDVQATVGAVTGSTRLTVTQATLSSIAVAPVNPSIARGTQVQMVATGTFSDGSTRDISSSVSWTSASPSQVSFAPSGGLATGNNVGSPVVTATFGAVQGTTTVTVTAATLVSLDVTPAHPLVVRGVDQQFTATGRYSDASVQDLTTMVTWSSSNTGAATISNAAGSQGLASTSGGSGQTSIGAQLGAVTGSTTLTVRTATLTGLTVNPVSSTIAKGTNQQFTCTGDFSDGTTADLTSSVTWSSDNAAATVSNAAGSRGLAFGAGAGSAGISAGLGALTSNTAALTVTAATLIGVQVTPRAQNVQSGAVINYTATGTYSDGSSQNLTSMASWSSSNPAVVTIGAATGVATTQVGSPGQSTITATVGAFSDSTNLTVRQATLNSIDVTPTSASIARGGSQQFTAIGNYADGSTLDLTTLVTWSSGTPAVAPISNANGSRGLATTSGTGMTSISCTLGSVTSNAATLNVTSATLTRLDVTPMAQTIIDGTTQAYTATGTFSDGSTSNLTGSVSWTSSDTTVATMSSNVATGQNAGATSIRATQGAIVGQTTLTVRAATLSSIAVTPASTALQQTASQQYQATGTYSDGSTLNITSLVTWASSSTSVATISNAADSKGLALALVAGGTNITATFGAVTSPNATLTVIGAIAPVIALGVNSAPPDGLSNNADVYNASGAALVSYSSDATNLVSGDTNGPGTQGRDLFATLGSVTKRLNLVNGTTQATFPAPPPGFGVPNSTDQSRIAQNGGFVVFRTTFSLLTSDTNYANNQPTGPFGGDDIYRVPISFPGGVLTAGVPVRVSEDGSGNQIPSSSSGFVVSSPDVSADGNYVCFVTNYNWPGNVNPAGNNQSYRKDMTTGALIKISVADGVGGAQSASSATAPKISNDGRYVGFRSSASNLVTGDTNSQPDVFIRDTVNNTTIRASLTNSGAQSSISDAPFPVGVFSFNISGNGQFVVFASDNNDLVSGDNNGLVDVFVRDLVNNTTERVSVADDESQGIGGDVFTGTYSLGISSNGRYVVFSSQMTNLDPTSPDTNGQADVFVRDRQTGRTRRVSLKPDRSQGLGTAFEPSISDDGLWISFSTDSALVSTDTNGTVDVYVVANPLVP